MSQYDINDPRNPNSPFNMSNPHSPWGYKNPLSPNYDEQFAETDRLWNIGTMWVCVLVIAVGAVVHYPFLLIIILALLVGAMNSRKNKP